MFQFGFFFQGKKEKDRAAEPKWRKRCLLLWGMGCTVTALQSRNAEVEMQWVIPSSGHLLVPSSQSVLGLMLFNILINDLSNGVEVIP